MLTATNRSKIKISKEIELKRFSEKTSKFIKKFNTVFLYGELGVGKTTFTRYLINYLQKKEGSKVTEVLSPTFNLLYEYDLNGIKIMHYDLYRIRDEKELKIETYRKMLTVFYMVPVKESGKKWVDQKLLLIL